MFTKASFKLHKIIPFYNVVFNEKKIEEIKHLIKKINKNLIKLNSLKNKMRELYEYMEPKKGY